MGGQGEGQGGGEFSMWDFSWDDRKTHPQPLCCTSAPGSCPPCSPAGCERKRRPGRFRRPMRAGGEGAAISNALTCDGGTWWCFRTFMRASSSSFQRSMVSERTKLRCTWAAGWGKRVGGLVTPPPEDLPRRIPVCHGQAFATYPKGAVLAGALQANEDAISTDGGQGMRWSGGAGASGAGREAWRTAARLECWAGWMSEKFHARPSAWRDRRMDACNVFGGQGWGPSRRQPLGLATPLFASAQRRRSRCLPS